VCCDETEARGLGKAELYLVRASVFGPFDMELCETSRIDVDPMHDPFIRSPDLISTGVSLMVKACRGCCDVAYSDSFNLRILYRTK